MVRINLLPERRQAKTRVAASEPGQLWVIGVAALLIVEIVLLFAVQSWKQGQLKTAQGETQGTQTKIDAINRQMADQAQIKAQLQELRDRESAIQKLEGGRTGPTNMMMELSKILTPGRGPTTDKDKLEQLKRDNPTAVPNPNWDARRVWLTQYTELERTVRMVGLAKDSDDVSEFERRLVLSNFFYDVNLLPGGRVIDPQSKQELVRFELSAKVRY